MNTAAPETLDLDFLLAELATDEAINAAAAAVAADQGSFHPDPARNSGLKCCHSTFGLTKPVYRETPSHIEDTGSA